MLTPGPVTILRRFEDVTPYLADVCAIADANRNVFGFLPDSAYEALAARDQLWIALDEDGFLAGHLVFGSSRFRFRIFQLHVDHNRRAQGIGGLLLSELKALAALRRYQTITARVAADLPANRFWERQGFRVLRQVAGGQTTGRLINERAYEVAGSSLWGVSSPEVTDSISLPLRQPILAPINYALDLNVLFDVTKDRQHGALMQDVIANALNNQYRLSVTSEFVVELERTSFGDDPILRLAKSLPTLPDVPSTTLKPLIAELKALVFPETGRSRKRLRNDQSDLRHLALCIHHKASGFITRESAILRNSGSLQKRYGVEALSPADLCTDIPASQAAGQVRAELQGGTLAVRYLMEGERALAEAFLSSQGVQQPRARIILEAGTTSARRPRMIASLENELVAVASWGPVSRHTREITLYLVADERFEAAQRAVDHVLETVMQAAPPGCMVKLNLMTLRSQVGARETALKRGFVLRHEDTEDDFIISDRYVYRQVVHEGNWAQFAGDLEAVTGMRVTRRCPTFDELTNTGLLLEASGRNEKSSIPLFALETSFAPLVVVGRNRPAVITPIQEHYAGELISTATPQTSLFAKEAPVRLERAYFGKPGLERPFARGAIVVFYISGQRNEAVGMARVTASGRYSINEAEETFARQGVLGLDELRRVSANDQVGVFTFDSYRNFTRPIPFAELRSSGIVNAANLVTSQTIRSNQLLDVMRLAQDL